MRLISLELEGFRGFPKLQKFDLDADTIVVVGANGQGKTSLFDGILWAVSGRIPRLFSEDAHLVSLYSESGEARVQLCFGDSASGLKYVITRSFDGKETRVLLETPDGSYRGPSAEGRLIELIWPDAALSSDPQEAVASVLTRSIYLQQDLVRYFIEAATDQERFNAVSELVGAGRVTELQVSLERAKKTWTMATNQRSEEHQVVQERLREIEGRVADLKESSGTHKPDASATAWAEWWKRISSLGIRAAHVDPTSREAANAIDSTMKQLEAIRRSSERRIQLLSAAREEIDTLEKQPVTSIQPVRDKLALLKGQLADLKKSVAEEQNRAAEQRRLQATLKEKAEQLKALATLALKHLDERCPVCEQQYDRERTKQRLQGILEGETKIRADVEKDRLSELLSNLTKNEKEVAKAEAIVRSAEQERIVRETTLKTIERRLRDLNIKEGSEKGYIKVLEEALQESEQLIEQLVHLQKAGESLAFQLAKASSEAAIKELSKEAETLRKQIVAEEKIITAREEIGEQAQEVIEALRKAGSAVVEKRLQDIDPLLQSIYMRIDPHPAFRLVTFLSKIVRGRGQLSTIVDDPIERKKSNLPSVVLSSSQVNALAVSVFLALNIGTDRSPLSITILDDPLQSLDDINLLGLVDLLRRARDQRQLLISTHVERYGNLLSLKLRPGNDREREIVIEMNGWSRKGPIVKSREILWDAAPLRLASEHSGSSGGSS